MRFRTLEIRWHDSKPISSCDFQPIPSFKKARPPNGQGQDERWATQSYKLATGGEDNHVRVWMVYPNIRPSMSTDASATTGTSSSSSTSSHRPPRVEYLATLSRHSAAVNVVRWSPNGELIASAGDDGMIIIWSPSTSPQVSTYGSDLSPEELQNEKEYWRVRCMVRCTTMQVYDLAWSPSGEYIIAGSTDNAARVFQAADGKCIHEIAEHNHYVQGVSWDPLNEYIATQSSDRSMHVYRISTPTSSGNKSGAFEAHAVGKNANISVNLGGGSGLRSGRKHGRTSSTVSAVSEGMSGTGMGGRTGSRPRMYRRESAASDAESAVSEYPSKDDGSDLFSTSALASKDSAPLTPATSVASTPLFPSTNASMFPPPPIDKEKQSSSRRSSFSGSNAPSSPAPSAFSLGSRYGRSPSPMPALPAIRTALHAEDKWKQLGLYGDESYTNFFRRLAFSPDGGLLVTPAGQFEDPEVVLPVKAYTEETTPSRGRKARPSISTDAPTLTGSGASSSNASSSCVYIYTRANFARPPVAQLPGYKKPSVAVKFSPVLFELRQGVLGGAGSTQPEHDGKPQDAKTATLEKGSEGVMDVDILGTLHSSASDALATPQRTPSVTPVSSQAQSSSSHSQSGHGSIVAPAPRPPGGAAFNLVPSPLLSPMDSMRPPTPAPSKPGTPIPVTSTPSQTPSQGLSGTMTTGSVFALPYRMLFAVVTMDTIAIYDTQQAGPFCMLTKLHYDEFTDVSWTPDGQCLLVSSRDGYCSLVTFDEILPAYHTQQQALQLQSIAHQHSMPITYNTPTPSSSSSRNNDHHGTASTAYTPTATPVFGNVGLPSFGVPSPSIGKRNASGSSVAGNDPPLTPAASVDNDQLSSLSGSFTFPQHTPDNVTPKREREEVEEATAEGSQTVQEPVKKKRRVALTRVSDLGS